MSFAYGFGLPHWQPLSGGFSPAGLFQAGVIGTFYDPSDLSTLFTSSAGTTPCAVPGSGSQVLVGLMLDKSQGAPGALGAELVTNGDFPINTAGWTAVNSPTLSIGVNGVTIQNNGGTNGLIYQAITTIIGRMYKIEGTITYGGGFARIETSTVIPTTVGGGNINVNASGRYTWYFVAVASTTYLVVGNRNDVNAANTYDNISVREIPGNHAIAFNDTTARPELSARVNLLTYSEDWANAVWEKLQSGTGVAPIVTNNFAAAPDGTQTAIRVQFNLGATPATAVSRLYQNANDGATTRRTKTIWAKTNDNSTKTIYFQGPQSANTLLTVTSTWTLFTISDASPAVGAYAQMQLGLDGSQGTSTTADILFWHPDIRQTNIGSAIPSYQRIADQYTYDSNGFPSYLRFDGVDDSMYTPASIPFATVTNDGLARRNLLSNPTQFDVTGSWNQNSIAVAANTTIAPDGTAAADTFTASAGTAFHYVYVNSPPSRTGTFTYSFYAKRSNNDWIFFTINDSFINYFNLATGQFGTTPDTCAATDVGNGWYRITATRTLSAQFSNCGIGIANANGSASFTAVGTEAVFIWGAQLETGSTATAFQNIGTDKMSVFAGVRKLSDAAVGMMVELTTNGYTTAGGFYLTAAGGAGVAGAFYGGALNGSSGYAADFQTFTAPITNVITQQMDIAQSSGAAELTMQANGASATRGTVAGTNAGTGNFGTYPLYIGSRNNSSLRFNGYLYSLIVAGAQLQSGSITATDQYVAGKTGVQI